MKKIIVGIIVLLGMVCLYSRPGPYYKQVTNSFGCDSIKIWDDSLRLDSNCDGNADYTDIADTTPAYEIITALRMGYVYTIESGEADGDSITYQEDVLCGNEATGEWASVAGWGRDNSDMDTIFFPTQPVGVRELYFGVCDSIKIITKAWGNTSHSDTVMIKERYLRIQD